MASLPLLTIPFSALSCRRPPTPNPSSPFLSRLVKAPNYSVSSLRQKQHFRFSPKRTPEDDDHFQSEPASKGEADSEASKEVNKAEMKPVDSKAPVEAEVESEPASKGKADSEASKDVNKAEMKPVDSKEVSKDVNQAEKKPVDSKAPVEAEVESEPASKGKADSEATKDVNKAEMKPVDSKEVSKDVNEAEKKPVDSKAPVEAEVESEPASKGRADSEASKDVNKAEVKPVDSKEVSKDVDQAEKKPVDSKASGEAEVGSGEISDKELGEKLLQRQPIQLLVDAFAKRPWPGQGEVERENLVIDWARRLAPVQHPQEFREMFTYKDHHWIKAYYGQGSAKIFFEMDSTNRFMRRRMVIMSFALNGLKLRELNCFPLGKFLELLSIADEEQVSDFQSLFSEMQLRANRINWGPTR